MNFEELLKELDKDLVVIDIQKKKIQVNKLT